MKNALAIGVCVLLGCTSAEKERYEALARRVNDSLRGLRPTAIAIDRSGNDAALAGDVADLCASSDSLLHALAATRHAFAELEERVNGEPDWRIEDAPRIAERITWDRQLYCKADDGNNLERCRRWCVERWNDLADGVEYVRAKAARHGVKLESLRDASR